MASSLVPSSTFAFVSAPHVLAKIPHSRLAKFLIGLQTQSAKSPIYKGPFDAIKQISSAHGISGIFKGQVATFTREAVGYGAYFCAYEMLVQRHMRVKNVKREELPAAYAVLYGAAAGYAVSALFTSLSTLWVKSDD